MTIPAYLHRVENAEYTYGTLRYSPKDNQWVIEGEPCVIEMAKRLFPGCHGRGQGRAKFPNTKRVNGDLNWLMLRYPLIIEDQERWEKAYAETVKHITKRQELLEHPQKLTPSLDFKGELKEFQKEGLGFLEHFRRTLLADEMGLGKTVQALAFLAYLQSYPALLVVPPHLVRNWEKEIDKFLRLPSKTISLFDCNDRSAVHTIKGLRPYKLPEASIYIIHYLLLRGWKKVLPELKFKTVIFDEIQELRHDGTEKYSAASLVAGSAENCIGLSGTPIYNYGIEMWNIMNIIEYHCLGDKDSFTREWCDGYGNPRVKDPALLGSYLKREGLMLRRTKEQVLKELPPKRRVIQTIDFDTGVYSDLIQSAVAKAHEIDSIKEYFERGRMTREIENETRQAIGIAKAPYVSTFVRMLLEVGEKVILCAYHHKVFDIYMDELREFKPVRITGRENGNEKDRAVTAFMTDQTNIVLLSLRAAAGLNLQKATCVVFGELDWSPAIHSQAEDRAHRIGQQDSVLCYYLVAEEGIDEAIQEVLGLKVSQFVGIMGDKEETEEDRALSQQKAAEHMNKVIERLKQIKIKVKEAS